jgi:hypothetical protein
LRATVTPGQVLQARPPVTKVSESWPDHLTMAGMHGDSQLASDGLAEGAAKSVRDLKTLVRPSLLPLPFSSPYFVPVHSR